MGVGQKIVVLLPVVLLAILLHHLVRQTQILLGKVGAKHTPCSAKLRDVSDGLDGAMHFHPLDVGLVAAGDPLGKSYGLGTRSRPLFLALAICCWRRFSSV